MIPLSISAILLIISLLITSTDHSNVPDNPDLRL